MPFSSGPIFLHDDRDEQVDDDAGSAHQAEPEQLDPVLPVAYEYVVPEAFHHGSVNTPVLLSACLENA